MAPRTKTRGLRIRLVLSDGVWIGPGKADLLEQIRETGSIAAAGRRLGMSYKRAWNLVETLNAMFVAPVIESSRGGAQFGGAHLTEQGARVLALYRELERKATSAGAAEIAQIADLLPEEARSERANVPARSRTTGK